MRSNQLTKNRFSSKPHFLSQFLFLFLLLFLSLVPLSRSSAMGVPAPYSPSNGATLTAFEVFMWWPQISGATGYEYMYDTTATFSSPLMVHDTSSQNYFYTQALWMNRKYRWKLRAYKSGDTSAWSAVSTFNVNLATPCTTYPASGNAGPITQFSSSGGAVYVKVGFQFEADTTPAFNSPLHVFRTDTLPYFQDTVLFDFGRKIYYRARAFNMRGDTMIWSTVSNYTISPAPNLNGSTGILMTDPRHIANWTNGGLSTIELQLDTLNSFNTGWLITDRLPRNTVNDTFNNLKFGKTYYYRIRFWYGGKASVWSLVRTIKVYPNGNISSPYSGETKDALRGIGFYWNSMYGCNYQFQLFDGMTLQQLLKDTNTSKNSYVYQGWLTLNKSYYFRVRYCTANDTTPWVLSYFKTYTGMPYLGSPYNGATKIPVRQRFTFRKPEWAVRCVMEIDTGVVFGSNHSRFYMQTDTFKFDGYNQYIDTCLGYGKRYVWKVTAYLTDTQPAQPAIYLFTTLGQTVNYYPPDQMIGTGNDPNALVTGINGSDSLEWERDTSALFDSPRKENGKVLHVPDDFSPQYIGVEWPTPLRFHTTYYWRTRCLNRIDTSKWSTPFRFLTTQEVWVVSPADRAVNVPYNPTLEWGIQGSSTTQIYQFRISMDSLQLAQAPIVTLPAESSSKTQVSLVYGRTYYWQARALTSLDTSHWSAMFRFTTSNPPGLLTPVLGLPDNGAKNINPAAVSFSWNYVSGALQYQLQVSKESSFTSFLVDTIITPTNFVWRNAEVKTRYYWRARARYNEFTGNWSGGRYFDTAPPTGLEIAANDASIMVYPNPLFDVLYVKSLSEVDYRITDLQGKALMHGHLQSGLNIINLQELQEGVYVIITEKGAFKNHQRIVVSRH